jgi:hypothetical protein
MAVKEKERVAFTKREWDAQIEAHRIAAYGEHGYTLVNADGDEVVDSDKFEKAALKVLMKTKVTEPTERTSKALSSRQLVSALFSPTPFENWSEYLDENDELSTEGEAWRKIESDCWSLANPGESGRLQKRLDDSDLVIVKARVIAPKPGRRKPEVGVYVADSDRLIFDDGAAGFEERIAAMTEAYVEWLNMCGRRRPHMLPAIEKRVDKATKQQSDLAKSKLALPTGEDES